MKPSGWTLPLFINRENKLVVGGMMFAYAAAIYLTTNHFPRMAPQFLKMTWLDEAVPFMPGTFWIYVSEWLFFAASYLLCARDEIKINKYFYAFVALQTTSCMIFWAWPTTYPREFFPLPRDLDQITHAAFTWLRATDMPSNCCPSLHVSSVYLAAFFFSDDKRRKFPFFFMWATAIAVSTLTTKQHYVADVTAGFMMALAHYWVFDKVAQYRPWWRTSSARVKR